MAFLGLFVYGLMGAALYQSYGHYHPYYVPYVFLGIVALVALAALRPEVGGPAPAGRVEALLILLALAFCCALAYDPRLRFATGPRWAVNALLWLLAAVPVLVAAGGVWLLRLGTAGLERRDVALVFGAAATVLWAGQFLVPLASPAPQIDVYLHSSMAARDLLTGVNPWTHGYPDLYGGANGAASISFPYWPGSLLPLAVSQALSGDIRFALVLAQGLSAAALFILGGRWGLSRTARVLFPLIWLSFPVQYFVVEQSWVDTFLVTCVLALSAAVQSRRLVLAALLAGLATSVKQYGALIPLATALWIWRRQSLREAVRFAAWAAAAFLVVMVPLVAWNPHAFFDSTLAKVGGIPFRLDSFTLAAYLQNEWELSFSVRALTIVSGGGALAGLGLLAVRRLSGKGVFQIDLALLASFSALFLLGRHAYCNYLQFLSVLVLLCAAHASAPAPAPAPGSEPTPSPSPVQAT
ncbi:MAG TPA: glycosyltransferase 87 family protein [Myxococcales bacterium]